MYFFLPFNWLILRTKVWAVLKILGTLFFDPLFFGLNQWFRVKTIWETHPTGSQRWKRGFLEFFKKKMRKITVFQWKNENWPKTVKNYRKCSKLFPNIICYCFYDMSTLEPDLGRFRPFLGHFRCFWLTCFRAKSRRPLRENFYFSGQILVLQTQTYAWIPKTHRTI